MLADAHAHLECCNNINTNHKFIVSGANFEAFQPEFQQAHGVFVVFVYLGDFLAIEGFQLFCSQFRILELTGTSDNLYLNRYKLYITCSSSVLSLAGLGRFAAEFSRSPILVGVIFRCVGLANISDLCFRFGVLCRDWIFSSRSASWSDSSEPVSFE